jgi:hypothetical protein
MITPNSTTMQLFLTKDEQNIYAASFTLNLAWKVCEKPEIIQMRDIAKMQDGYIAPDDSGFCEVVSSYGRSRLLSFVDLLLKERSGAERKWLWQSTKSIRSEVRGWINNIDIQYSKNITQYVARTEPF